MYTGISRLGLVHKKYLKMSPMTICGIVEYKEGT